MEKGFTVFPIARVETDFKEKFGIPRQSGSVPEAEGRIVFLPKYRNPDALRELDGFSHLWLIFDFSESHRTDWSPTVRPPRLGGNRHVGVFASRSPFRPNPIGLSSVRLLRIEKTEHEGDVLIVSGVDLLDGTPNLDIELYLPFTDSHPQAKCGYAEKVRAYRLPVNIPLPWRSQLPKEKYVVLQKLLEQDPRPSYQADENRIYHFVFDRWGVHFKVDEDGVSVTGIDPIR